MTDMPRILACICMKIGGDRVMPRVVCGITLSSGYMDRKFVSTTAKNSKKAA